MKHYAADIFNAQIDTIFDFGHDKGLDLYCDHVLLVLVTNLFLSS